MSTPTVADIVAALDRRFPESRAESWDRVGLLAGDPAISVTGVHCALDPTLDAIGAAVSAGANVLVTHHPAFLDPPDEVVAGPGSGGVVFAAISAGVALVNAHTNLDRDAAAQRLLPARLGLTSLHPLERSVMAQALVTVYVPRTHAEAVATAMTAAGAGRIGDYEGCRFSSAGVGSFTPPVGSAPFSGTPGAPSTAEEQRLEMVAPTAVARSVVAAAVGAHPYEEPLVTVTEVSVARGGARFGMVCEPAGPLALAELARRAAEAYGSTVRVWGGRTAAAQRVVCATGSAGSLLGEVRAAGADTLIAGEVRYHDAMDAVASGIRIVELGHDVSEWPLVALLEEAVHSVEGLDASLVSRAVPRPNWWSV